MFVVASVRHMGWRRTGIYALVSVTLGAIAENLSVHVGLPYTTYSFAESLRGEELWIGDVPLMVSLSYGFMGYFGFAVGRLLASGPWRTRGRRVWQEVALGVMVSLWAIWLFDPIAQRGGQWFLGDLFHYAGPGFWFGLPLGSQVGFTVMSALMVGLLAWMNRDEPDVAVTDWRRHPHGLAFLTYHGQLVWLVTMAIWIDDTELGAAMVLMWVPIALMTAVVWSNQRAARAQEATP